MGKQTSIVIATGGSGGHVIPSGALAKKLQNLGLSVTLCGHYIETNPYLSTALECNKVNIIAAPLKFRSLFYFFIKNGQGFFQALKELKKIKPSCVVGFGSYHSFPVLLAALVLRIPLVLYEANTIMGKVIQLFSSYASVVASPFDGLNHLKNFYHVNPLINELSYDALSHQELLAYFGLEVGKKTVLIMGGSQGAAVLNTHLAWKVSRELCSHEFQVIHLAGASHPLDPLKSLYETSGFKACVKSYEDKMACAYKLCDLVICRSGATTLFELSHFQKSALLIPFAQSTADHQKNNALHYARYHKAFVVEEDHINQLNLTDVLRSLMMDDHCSKKREGFFGLNKLEQRVLELC